MKRTQVRSHQNADGVPLWTFFSTLDNVRRSKEIRKLFNIFLLNVHAPVILRVADSCQEKLLLHHRRTRRGLESKINMHDNTENVEVAVGQRKPPLSNL